ncbi:GDSL esterase lipase At5g33370-like [Olea europaea subsp. europaea]|uniref:GDSL esterase lipase At5g33370-like n=1 Tax=Olea europaea subsp. europaea TaxID=158383 RepID=A0A8S0PJB9_OLEEU|nr:GDSL esterase lipase At5g33370-like [Olea europaea subsp. europaea]
MNFNNPSVYFVLVLILALRCATAKAEAFFVFGDSLVDIGNNNFLVTTARADMPPYGIDYPTHSATGRFSNGLNIADLISEKLGWEPLMPCLHPNLTGKKLLVGANFASAGVGILDDTGFQFVNMIRIYDQLNYFQQYQKNVKALIGEGPTEKLINESLVLITLGGNDFVNNYYLMPLTLRSLQFELRPYVAFLIVEYKKILQRLYELGARRILVTGTGPIGCTPAELALHSKTGECAEELQFAASLFNSQLVLMIDQLNKKIGYDVFVAVNTNAMHMEYFINPQAFGFKESKTACCGQGPYNGFGLCTVFSNICDNRDDYVFWDPFHPSERANRLIVEQIFNGSRTHMYPKNLNTIMALDSRV